VPRLDTRPDPDPPSIFGFLLPVPAEALVRPLLLFLLVLLPPSQALLGCGPESTDPDRPPTISREAFVDAYVALRIAALQDPRQRLEPGEKTRILAQRNLSEEDLLTFAEVHGTDVPFMRDIWQEVDSIMREKREPGDSTRVRGSVED
jgi:hypothetical protein